MQRIFVIASEQVQLAWKRKAGRARRGNPVNKNVSAMPTAI